MALKSKEYILFKENAIIVTDRWDSIISCELWCECLERHVAVDFYSLSVKEQTKFFDAIAEQNQRDSA